MATWLQNEGLLPAYGRIYDVQPGEDVRPHVTGNEYPRDLPSSHVQLLQGALSGMALQQTLLGAAEHHTPATALLNAQYLGRPRLPFSDKSMRTSFEVFPPGAVAPAAALGAAGAGAPRPFGKAPSFSGEMAAASGPSASPGIGGSFSAVPSAPNHVPAGAGVGGGTTLRLKLSLGGGGGGAGTASSSSSAAAAAPAADPLDAYPLDPATLADIHARIGGPALGPAHTTLAGLRWADWPLNEGNPFVIKITKANAATLGVPGYFDVVASPMDLTRVRERLEGKAKPYASPDAFIADLRLIASNAKRFNCPPSWVPTRDAYLPPVEEVRAKQPKQLLGAPVYRMAWELDGHIDALEVRTREAWRAAFAEAKRAALAAAGVACPPPS